MTTLSTQEIEWFYNLPTFAGCSRLCPCGEIITEIAPLAEQWDSWKQIVKSHFRLCHDEKAQPEQLATITRLSEAFEASEILYLELDYGSEPEEMHIFWRIVSGTSCFYFWFLALMFILF
jgi:hypothetical protein